MEYRRTLVCVILAWAGIFCLLIPQVHANETKDLGKDLSISAQRLLIKVRDLMDQKDYNGAIKLIQATKNKSDDKSRVYNHPLVYLALGNCYLMIPDYVHAESSYLAALELTPGFHGCQGQPGQGLLGHQPVFQGGTSLSDHL